MICTEKALRICIKLHKEEEEEEGSFRSALCPNSRRKIPNHKPQPSQVSPIGDSHSSSNGKSASTLHAVIDTLFSPDSDSDPSHLSANPGTFGNISSRQAGIHLLKNKCEVFLKKSGIRNWRNRYVIQKIRNKKWEKPMCDSEFYHPRNVNCLARHHSQRRVACRTLE